MVTIAGAAESQAESKDSDGESLSEMKYQRVDLEQAVEHLKS